MIALQKDQHVNFFLMHIASSYFTYTHVSNYFTYIQAILYIHPSTYLTYTHTFIHYEHFYGAPSR